MKSLKFSRDSWHYKLAHNVTKYEVYTGEEVDLCGYTWRVIGSILLILFLSLMALGISYVAIQTALGIAFSLWYGAFLFNDFGFVGLLFTFIGLTPWGVTTFIKWNRARRWAARSKNDSFVKNAYRGMKEKYCARVTFDDIDE